MYIYIINYIVVVIGGVDIVDNFKKVRKIKGLKGVKIVDNYVDRVWIECG